MKPDRPPLFNYLATDAMWWLGYFIFSFVIGWDITDQLQSPFFWIVTGLLTAWSLARWRSSHQDTLAARSAELEGGHQQAPLHDDEKLRRGLISYVGVALVGLVLCALFVDSTIADGRSILVSEDLTDAGFEAWSGTIEALDAEILGLTLYDYSLFVGLIIVAFEIVALYRRRDSDKKLWFADTLASLSTQIPFYFIEIFITLAMLGAYFVIWDNLTLWQLPINGWTLALGLLAADFAYYWEHRTSHEVRLLWTGHAVHHSSPLFNTAVAFRFGPFEPVLAVLFHLPLVLLGFHPAVVIFGELAVQAYQFWIHTEVIGKLGPVDRWLNTPSNHRVHHGSDRKYLDRNHGGILMVWDRMFGTYQAEEETPTYGLTTQIETTNPLKVWFSEFPSLFADMRTAESWNEWFGYMLNRPGWRPVKES